MIVHWTLFLPALALLLVPIALFHGPKVRYRGIAHDWRDIWKQTFALGLHTVDFCRATLGAWWLLESLQKGAHATGAMRFAVPATGAAVLLSATLLQTTFRAKPDSVHAPFVFLGGLVFGFYPPAIAAYALLLATVTAFGTKAPAVFFPILAFALPGVGSLFARGLLPSLVVGSLVALLPWLWSLLFSREMVVSYRGRRPSEGSSSAHPHRA
ncbi:MAG: hypothetical protein HY302_04515 [Opitutae bacterium]|nr:hypothetical protein [Opitutae bacterium]